MKNIKIVIGANFGDEGKGLMTDYFCSQLKGPVLNIRYNGSCQAGHTVVKGNKRHVFSHFGAGSFNENVVTYLSSYFYINPILFNSEYDKLISLGITPKVLVDKDAHVVLLYDMLLNRETEISRGGEKHGSCGLGLWEAILRERDGYCFKVSEMFCTPLDWYRKIVKCRDTYFQKIVEERFHKTLLDMETENMYWYDEYIVDLYIMEIKKMLSRIEIVNSSVIKEYNNIVFEGAQGLLLDWGNREYMPHLTASYTGLRNVVSILKDLDLFVESDIEVCYVTRTYMTRHGAGRFDSEVSSRNDLGLFEDKTNVYNKWQGSIRYGLLDIKLLKKSIENDLKYFDGLYEDYKVSLAITHLNETNNSVYSLKGHKAVEEVLNELQINCKVYYSKSENSYEITGV